MSVKMRWDKRKVLHLIKLFRETESLWNRRHPGYSDRIKRDDHLCAIARCFGPGVYSKEILRKIKNLRSHYLREQKRYEDRVARHGEQAPASKWFAFEHLHFLLERRLPPRRRSPLTRPRASPNLIDVVDIKIEPEEQPHADTGAAPQSLEVTVAPRSPPATSLGRIQPAAPPAPPAPPEDPTRDEEAIFAEYIAIKLRQLDPVSKSTVQHHIHNLIFQAEMGAYAGGAPSPARSAVSATLEHAAEAPPSPASASSGESDGSATDTKPTITPPPDPQPGSTAPRSAKEKQSKV